MGILDHLNKVVRVECAAGPSGAIFTAVHDYKMMSVYWDVVLKSSSKVQDRIILGILQKNSIISTTTEALNPCRYRSL